MQRKLFLFLSVCVLGLSPVLAGRSGDQGYGILIGNPTGLSGKIWMNDMWAIDGAIGVARSEFDVHATVLLHNFDWGWARRVSHKGSLPFYIGAGPRLLFEDDVELGLRTPIGLSYFPNSSDWEYFGEFAPVIRLTPDVGLNADFGIGVRYYFHAIRPKSASR